MFSLCLSRRSAVPLAGVGIGLLSIALLSTRAGTAAESRPGGAPAPLLRLRSGIYDPLGSAVVTSRAEPSGRQTALRDLYLVQFRAPIRRDWRQALEQCGAAVIEYVPDFAYLVRASTETAARFAALPGYRWHGMPDASALWREAAPRAASTLSIPVASPLLPTSSARLAAGGSSVLLDVMTLPDVNIRNVERRLPGRVVQRYSRRRGFFRVQVSPEAAARVAQVPGVAWVERYEPPVLFSDVAGGLMRVPAAREELGLYGRGQVIAVADTGLDVGSIDGVSADFRGRVRRGYAVSRSATGDWSDQNGHGTHVCGAAVGAGVLSGAEPAYHLYDGSFAGMAPEAGLVIQSIGAANGSLSLPADIGQLLLPPYRNDGARIHSDSWGSNQASFFNQYLLNTWQIDDVCWQNRDLVVLFAAGNGGTDANGDGVVDAGGLSPQATAKNAITVGASESFRDQGTTWGSFPIFPSDPLHGDRMADHPSGIAAFSSRGPTSDGRIKPDLVAPGTWVVSTRSHASGAGSLWGAVNGDYAYSGGTSMAAPLVAGAAALVREGLQEQYGVANPSSALVKAVLINGADELAPGQYGTRALREIPPRPNPVEGWGRVNVRRSLAGGGGRAMLPIENAAGMQTEERRKYPLTVVPGEAPLRVTLTWTDPPSSLLAGVHLVNDLDLKLLTPDGRWLFGNGSTDRLNNVEAVEIPQPAPGAYTIVIDAYNVPQGPQPFALVASGPIQSPAATGLQGVIRVGGSSLPLAAADVSVAGNRSLQLTSSATGGFEARLPAGSYTLTPSRPGWSFDPPSRSVTLADGQTVTAEFTATAAAGSLTGVVLVRDGVPIAGVRVALSPGDQTATTGSDGSYRFTSLPPLVYTVTPALAEAGFSPAARRVRVPAAGAARADFTLAATALQGIVVATGPVQRQVVASAHPARAAGSQSWSVSRPGARWIRVHFSRIDVQPGTERVEVLDPFGRVMSRWSGSFTDVWSQWVAGSSVTVRHTAGGLYARYGFEMDGVQTDLGGRPLADAAIVLQPGSRSARTNSLGGYRFSGLSGNGFTLAPALQGWEFFPPLATITLPPGTAEGSANFVAQGPPSVSGQVTVTGTTQAARYESLHPYPHNNSRVQEISVSGATRLRLHFARLATEPGADTVCLLSPEGKELKRLSGIKNDFWTEWLPAGRLLLKFESDDSLNDWGYLIDSIAWDGGAGGAAAGASVTLSPGGASAVTDAEGTYILTDVAPGNYTLKAAAPGFLFAPAQQPVTVAPEGATASPFEATRVAAPASPGLVAALTAEGEPKVRAFVGGSWVSLPAPGSGPFERLLALQGVNGTPELIGLAHGHLGHCRLIDGEWTPWVRLHGGETDRAPVAAAAPDGTLDVLAVGPEGKVLHFRYVDGDWQEPAEAAVPAWEGEGVALAAREDGTLELIAVGSDRLPRHSTFRGGAWTNRGAVGTLPAVSRPAIAIGTGLPAAEAPLELAFVAENGRVLHQRLVHDAWSTPRAARSRDGFLVVEPSSGGAPALVSRLDTRLEMVVPTADGVYHAPMRAGSWSDAQRIDGIDARSLALAILPQADPPAALELFVTGTDGVVTHVRYRDGRWSAPSPLAGLLATGPPAPASR